MPNAKIAKERQISELPVYIQKRGSGLLRKVELEAIDRVRVQAADGPEPRPSKVRKTFERSQHVTIQLRLGKHDVIGLQFAGPCDRGLTRHGSGRFIFVLAGCAGRRP